MPGKALAVFLTKASRHEFPIPVKNGFLLLSAIQTATRNRIVKFKNTIVLKKRAFVEALFFSPFLLHLLALCKELVEVRNGLDAFVIVLDIVFLVGRM